MTTKDKKTIHEEGARERLLAAALKVFTAKGYAAATIRELVDEACVTKPVLYYYYGNKEGLFLELLKTQFANIESVFIYYQNRDGNARKRFMELFEKVSLFVLENRDFIRLMHSIYYGPPQGAPFFDCDAYYGRFHAFITQFVKEAIKNGEFRKGNAADMAWIIMGAVQIAMEDQISFKKVNELDWKVLKRLLNLIFDGMAAKPISIRS
jgi:TetR/AcrR family transcriptional regulator